MVWLCTVRDGQEAYLRSAHSAVTCAFSRPFVSE